MSKQSIFERYTPAMNPSQENPRPALCFIFNAKKILLKKGGNAVRLPYETDFEGLTTCFVERQYLGEFDGFPCYCMEAPSATPPAAGMAFEDIRELADEGDGHALFSIAGIAYHIFNWSRVNRFCGRCGGQMREKPDERARVCQSCGNVVYPRISPATITAVHRGDEILLAHNRAFNSNLYSVVAGFVEPGEALEDCVRREVLEETGVNIKNIRYFGSQPWPFPDSLMLAFTAEYDSGEVHADGVEIAEARFFKSGDFPTIPGPESIAGRMIREFTATYPPAQPR